MQDLRINDRFSVPSRELQVSVSRSSGPGGQHVNTTDTRIRIHFRLSESKAFPETVRDRMLHKLGSRLSGDGTLVITCDRHRSQHRNLDEALDRLREILLDALKVPRARRKTRPSRSVVRRRLDGKKRRSKLKKGRKKPSEHDG